MRAFPQQERGRRAELAESRDVGQISCDDNQKQFKGIFMRYFAHLPRATSSTPCWAADREALNRIGRRRPGGAPEQLNRCIWASRPGALV